MSMTAEELAKEIGRIYEGDDAWCRMVATGLLPFIERHIAASVPPRPLAIAQGLIDHAATVGGEAATHMLLAAATIKAMATPQPPKTIRVDVEQMGSCELDVRDGVAYMPAVTVQDIVNKSFLKPAGAEPLPSRWHEELNGMRAGARLYDMQQEWVKFDDAIHYGAAREAAAREAAAREAAGRADAVPASEGAAPDNCEHDVAVSWLIELSVRCGAIRDEDDHSIWWSLNIDGFYKLEEVLRDRVNNARYREAAPQQMTTQGEAVAPYGLPFTTDVPQCCESPATCPEPCDPPALRGLPSSCRERLRLEGKPYPRSGCLVCKTGGMTGCPYPIPGADAEALTHEVKRWCHGDGDWSNWQPCTAKQAEEYAKDDSVKTRPRRLTGSQP